MESSLSFIVENWDSGNPESFSSISILALFDFIGHDCSFNRNGEFGLLYADWLEFFPTIDRIANMSGKEDLDFIKSCLKHPKMQELSDEVYNIKFA